MEEQLHEHHADFVRSMKDELLQRHTIDALATYLKMCPNGVQVNMDELEALIPL